MKPAVIMYRSGNPQQMLTGNLRKHSFDSDPLPIEKQNGLDILETIVNFETDYNNSDMKVGSKDNLSLRKRPNSCDGESSIETHERLSRDECYYPIRNRNDIQRNYNDHENALTVELEPYPAIETKSVFPHERRHSGLPADVYGRCRGEDGNDRSDESESASRSRRYGMMTGSSSISNCRLSDEVRMDVESVRSGRSDRDSERGGHRGPRSSYRRSRSRDKHREKSRDDEGEQVEDERIEVQILPQDDNWGDNQTQITTATSETGFSMIQEAPPLGKDFEGQIGFECSRYAGSIFSALLGLGAFLSPIAMVVIPKLGLREWPLDECTPECEGTLISFSFKLLILLIGSWALFARRPRANMPRVFIFRALVLFLIFVLTFAFWLFYAVRIIKDKMSNYYRIVEFSVSLVDALLFIHYLAIILLEIRQLQPMYVLKVVRSPDGETHFYNVGQLSIQRAAVWCLENYMKDFETYNPYLEAAPKRVPKMASNFKLYDVDGKPGQVDSQVRSRAVFAAAARRRDASHNDRFYEEEEYLRRVRKRRARLIVAAEEAFSHIKRMNGENGPALPMDPHETAQAIFPSMARSLQKYLRITRQQPRYTVEGILAHLATCLGNDMSPKAFLEKYLVQGPCVQSERDLSQSQHWVLVCEQLLSRAIEHGTIFQLKQGEVALLCSVRRIPHFNIREEVQDPKLNKFVLRLQSETSV